MKYCRTPNYNYNFNIHNGYFERWGENEDIDPPYSPIGPEIIDISVSSICHKGCSFCYRDNKPSGKNMSLENFKVVLSKLPTVTQVALGIGDIADCVDLFPIMEHCREKGVVPNLTINGRVTKEEAKELARLAGAVAVSNYDSSCYNAVDLLTTLGLKQVNIHQLMSEETYESCVKVLEDANTDSRLKSLNAVVFLSLKQRGRGVGFHPLSLEKKFKLYQLIQESSVGYGFDSCGSSAFLQYLKITNQPELEQFVEPCESTAFSGFINTDCKFFPCSFTEEGKGIDLLTVKDFLSEVWFNPKIVAWRNNLLACGRACPVYSI
jgi:hypothetical protein